MELSKQLEPELMVVGNTVYKVRREIEAQMNFDDLVTKVSEERGDKTITTPPLPAADGACRVYAERGDVRGLLIQNNPCVREIEFHNGHTNTNEKYKISLPWVWVMCIFKRVSKERYEWCWCYLCATYQNITKNDLTDPVYRVPLPNQHNNGRGRMCTGSAFTGMDESISLTAQKWQRSLWDSIFNSDLEPSIPRSLEAAWQNVESDSRAARIASMFAQWQKMTEDNPIASLSRDFGMQEYGMNIGSFIRRAMGGDD